MHGQALDLHVYIVRAMNGNLPHDIFHCSPALCTTSVLPCPSYWCRGTVVGWLPQLGQNFLGFRATSRSRYEEIDISSFARTPVI